MEMKRPTPEAINLMRLAFSGMLPVAPQWVHGATIIPHCIHVFLN